MLNCIKYKKSGEPYLLDKILSNKDCDKLIKYFIENIEQKKCDNKGNSVFNNRIIYFNKIDKNEIKVILNQIKYTILTYLKNLYNVENLYPESCHMVKWVEGQELGIHADNAYYPTGEPNYTNWKTYSAVLFLNDNFKGGEFYFSENKNIFEEDTCVKPNPGYFVGFGAGVEYFHGVKPVIEGTRYTVAMWFADDNTRIEI
jgi:predicted 2-oxoglutarate/Fe(II)-dependent dioxygenase YbiX